MIARRDRPVRDILALVGLATIALIVYWQTIGRGFILLGFDTFAYFYPLMAYRDLRLQAGELPLWAPGYFLGAPFLANPQTGVLYPPNWLTLPLSPPRAYAWQAFGHTILLAGGCYLFARRVLRVGVLAATVAATVAAYGGFGQSLVGHLNQLQAAAWLGLALVLADHAVIARSPRATAGLALVLAIQVLAGHAQQVYMTIALLGAWLIGRAATAAAPPRDLRGVLARALPIVVVLALAGGLAGAIAAAQLLPTLEVTGQGIRAGGMTYREAAAFSLPPWVLPISLLPVYGPDNQPGSEWLGYAGVVALALAALGLVAGRPRQHAWLLGVIAIGALLLALGQFGPLYPLLYKIVPGLGLFRVPARWLFVYSFAVAMLVGLGVERLRHVDSGVSLGPRPRPLVGVAALAIVVSLAFLVYATLVRDYPLQLPAASVVLIWGVLAGMAVALIAAGLRGWRWAAPTLFVAIVLELIVATWPLDVNRVGPPEAYADLRPTEAHLYAQIAATPGGPYRTLAITDSGFDPGDLALVRAQVAGVLDPARVEDWVAAIKHKDTLTPNLPLRFGIPSIDGYDGGVLPLRSYVEMKELFPLKAANLNDGRLGIQLEQVPSVDLLSWLNVRWVIMDRHRDIWIDGVYYDLAIQTPIGAGATLAFDNLPSARTSGIGIIAWPGDDQADESPLLDVAVTFADGTTWLGQVDVEGVVAAPASNADARVALQPIEPRPGATARGLVRLRFGRPPAEVTRIVIRAERAAVLGGLTLIDEANVVDWPVPAAPALRYSALGDVKVYENTRVQARAYLVHGVLPVPDDAAARAAVAAGLDTRATAAVVGADPDWTSITPGALEPEESVEILSYAPERSEIALSLRRRGALVLSDATYPGWTATLDGEPVAIHHANGGVRAVLVPAGDHRVAFAYQSERLRYGLLLTGIGLLGALALAILPQARRIAPPPAPP